MQSREEWEKMLTGIALTGAGGFLFGAARGIIQQRYGGWLQWVSLLSASVTVGVLVGLGVSDTGLTEKQKFAAVGLCAFLAEDIVLGFVLIAGFFSKDPFGTIRQLWNAIRGR